MVVASRPSELLDASERIERRIYIDEDIYQEELTKIFRRSWVFVGVEAEIEKPRDFITAMIGEEPVIITRDLDGQIKGFFNTCTHRAAIIAPEKRGSCLNFRCMYHGWSFDLEGKLTGVPYPEAYGEDFDKRDFDIPQIRVENFEGLLFASIDPLVPDLDEYLGEIGPWLRRYSHNERGFEVLGRVRWRYPGNWKLWHENFADNYHPEFVHKTIGAGYKGQHVTGWNFQLDDGHGLLLFPYVSQRNVPQQQEQMIRALGRDISFPQMGGGTNRNPDQMNVYNDDGAPPSPDAPEIPHGILTVFPTLDVQSGAGPMGQLPVLQAVRPEGVGSAIVEAWALGVKGSPPEVRQRRLDRTPGVGPSDFISADDTEAAARCQVGAFASGVPLSNAARGRSGGKQGEKRDEYSIRSFHRGWKMYMGWDF